MSTSFRQEKCYLGTQLFDCFQICYFKLEELPDYEKHKRQSLTECVLNATQRFFEEGANIIYSLPLSEVKTSHISITALDRFVLASLARDSHWSLVIKNVTLEQHKLLKIQPKPGHYIIQIRHQEEFIEHIDILKSYKEWNPHAKFLIISASKFDNPKILATEIIKKLWEVHALNGVVLLLDHSNDTLFHAYTWFPYEEGNCGTDFDKIVLMDSCTFGRSTKFVNWYPNKIPDKFNKCPIRVRMIKWPPYIINVPNGSWSNSTNLHINRGIEVNMLDMIAKIFNVRMYYYYSAVPLNWGDIYPNGSITGNLKHLYDEEDDITIGAYAKTMLRSFLFLDTFYHYDSLHWCVPHSPQHSKLGSVSKIMDNGAFTVTLFLYFFLTVMMWVSSGDSTECRSYQNFTNGMFKMFSVLLGLPVNTQPRTDGVRFFMAILMVYSFYLVTAYQTLLASALANVNHQERIRNIEDIIRNDLKIYAIKTSVRYFPTDGSNEKMNKINAAVLARWKNCKTMEECLHHVAFTRNAAVCLPKLFMEYIGNSYRTQNSDPLIHCFDKTVVSYPISILMRKGLHLYEKINCLIIRIVSAGFILKWERDILSTRYENFTNFAIDVKNDSETLDFDSLKPIFVVWMVGCAAATTALVLEIIYNKCLYNAAKRFFKEGDNVIYSLPLDEVEGSYFGLKHKEWEPRAKFLIISASNFDNPKSLATEILKKLWEVHAVNSVVLFSDPFDNALFHAYTWFPYEGGDCGNNFDKIVLIDSCTLGKSTEFVNWYPNKIPDKLNDCTIRVRMTKWPPYIINVPNGSWSNSINLHHNRGFEVSILDMIDAAINVNMFYQYSDIPLDRGNLKHLHDERADIAIGAYAKTMPRSLMFDESFYNVYASLLWCVPHSPVHSKLHTLSKIVNSRAFVVIAGLYLILTVLIWLSNGQKKSFGSCMLKTFQILLGLSIPTQFQTNRVRFFIAILMVYSFYLVIAYQSLLTSALAVVLYEEQINNVEDILKSNLKIYGVKTAAKYFSTDGSNEEINAAILARWRYCDNMVKCFDYVAFRRDSAILASKFYMEYIINNYRSKNNDPLIHCFDKSVVNFPMTIYMRKGFELYERIDSVIMRIVSSGFILKWQRDILHTNFTILKHSSDDLSFDSLKPVFLVWLVGCVVSTVIFFLEVIYNKWNNRIL
ncbi:uncharacterized protein BDFB_005853 [Asbolus verrucosus]|uniref:Lig chan domain containing protein n=1 Tax=Asbolus verrucosus TaxID=1661398 RepID=A0A482VDY7_ASBVE|nr:uncharacterized protein BDFB_005853 [Asbolus verrucosus]